MGSIFSNDNQTPAFINACKKGDTKTVKCLVDNHEFDINSELKGFKYAIHNGRLEFLKNLIDNYDVNLKAIIKYVINKKDKYYCFKTNNWSLDKEYVYFIEQHRVVTQRKTRWSTAAYSCKHTCVSWIDFYGGDYSITLGLVEKVIKHIISKNKKEINDFIGDVAINCGYTAVVKHLGEHKHKQKKVITSIIANPSAPCANNDAPPAYKER